MKVHVIDGPNQDFASRLVDLRRRKNMTQHELAQAIETDKRSISMYENGRTFPREETLRRLSQKLDVDPYWLSTGNTPELKQYLEEQQQKAENTENLERRVELLYIESWDNVSSNTVFARKIYTKNPTSGNHSTNINLFIPVIKTVFQRYRAVALPCFFPCYSSYGKGSVVVFDETKKSLEKIPSGNDVIFRIAGKENKPGVRKLFKEPGIEPTLIPVDSNYNVPAIVVNDLNVEILGVVIAIFKPQ